MVVAQEGGPRDNGPLKRDSFGKYHLAKVPLCFVQVTFEEEDWHLVYILHTVISLLPTKGHPGTQVTYRVDDARLHTEQRSTPARSCAKNHASLVLAPLIIHFRQQSLGESNHFVLSEDLSQGESQQSPLATLAQGSIVVPAGESARQFLQPIAFFVLFSIAYASEYHA